MAFNLFKKRPQGNPSSPEGEPIAQQSSEPPQYYTEPPRADSPATLALQARVEQHDKEEDPLEATSIIPAGMTFSEPRQTHPDAIDNGDINIPGSSRVRRFSARDMRDSNGQPAGIVEQIDAEIIGGPETKKLYFQETVKNPADQTVAERTVEYGKRGGIHNIKLLQYQDGQPTGGTQTFYSNGRITTTFQLDSAGNQIRT